MSTTPPVRSTETKHVPTAILGVMFGLLPSMLDNFIVGTALPSIIRELGGASLLAWVVTVYALTTAVTTPIWAKLGDLFGRKHMLQLAVVLFIVGSVLAAAAPSMGLLMAARAFQGIGAGGLAVSAFAVIGDLVPPRERGKYQAMTAIVVAAGTIGGPLLGGFITDGLGWRWAFLINLPLGALAIAWVAAARARRSLSCCRHGQRRAACLPARRQQVSRTASLRSASRRLPLRACGSRDQP